MSGWLTPQTLAGAVLVLVFAGIAFSRPSRGIWLYAVLGAIPPAFQIGSFSGRTISQGLLAAELLATVLIVGWAARRLQGIRTEPASLNVPLVTFAVIVVLSLVRALALPDALAEREATLLVSAGQVLLVVWPIGVYLAAADAIDSPRVIARLHYTIIALAVPQVLMPILPAWLDQYLVWTITFGLFAAPLAMAAAAYSSSLSARLFYIAIALVPLARGIQSGKAFLYVYVATAAMVVLWLRARSLAMLAGGLAAALALGVVGLGHERMLAAPLERLVEIERNQLSWDGRSGRMQIAGDALSIAADAPLLGVGPGNSYVYMLQRSPIATPHNQYLNILVEFGAAGLLAWLCFLVMAFHTGLRVYQRARQPAHAMFALGWLGMFAGLSVGGLTGDFMIHSIRNGGLELFSGYYLQWVLLGAVVAVPRLEGLARPRAVAGGAWRPGVRSRGTAAQWARPSVPDAHSTSRQLCP